MEPHDHCDTKQETFEAPHFANISEHMLYLEYWYLISPLQRDGGTDTARAIV